MEVHNFEFSEKEEKDYQKWRKKLPKGLPSANNCSYVKFTLTGIGTCVEVGLEGEGMEKYRKNITDFSTW